MFMTTFHVPNDAKLAWALYETMKLTHCGLVTSYGDRDLGQHWLR